jgi:hypothetical protein
MLVLGVVIGASLAVASPSRPSTPPRPSPAAPGIDPSTGGDPGGASGVSAPNSRRACAGAISGLVQDGEGHAQAIASVLRACVGNPQAPGLVNALLRVSANAGRGHGLASKGGANGGGPRGGGSGGTGGSGATGGSGRSGASGGSGPGTGGSGSNGSNGSNGKALGHHDGKGHNG